MTEKITTNEAARILDVAISHVRTIMFPRDGTHKTKDGHIKNTYYKSRVEYTKKIRDIRKRKEQKNNIKVINKLADPNNQMVDTSPVYRGSICHIPGCNNPIPTGCYVCPEHREEFRNRRRNYDEEYIDHS